jgi:DNA-binding FadR family transcriptional regulator
VPPIESAEQYGVSWDTIRRALQELVSDGLVMILHGRVRESAQRLLAAEDVFRGDDHVREGIPAGNVTDAIGRRRTPSAAAADLVILSTPRGLDASCTGSAPAT